MRKLSLASLLSLVAMGAMGLLVSGEREAQACGGCFVPPQPPQQPNNPQTETSSVVSDHRMVFAISTQETVLWDQIRYNGNPEEFAWVLPVKQGSRIELSQDEFISTLDAFTQPQIREPIRPQSNAGGGGPMGGGGFGGEGSGGCNCLFMSSSEASSFDGARAGDPSSSGASDVPPPPPPVQVVSEQAVGPYESIIVRSTDSDALQKWLRDHDYNVPAEIDPVIDAYTAEGFDFIALRLKPGVGVRAMKPVRIVTPGADVTLPLRMVAAGIGSSVGLTLFVISEGRYRPQNFPEGSVDDKRLFWNAGESRSNYQELAAAIMTSGGGRTWLTEYAQRGTLSTKLGVSPITNAYYNTCIGKLRDSTGNVTDAGADASSSDGGSSNDGGLANDGGSDGGPIATNDAGTDGAATPANKSAFCQTGRELCCDFDDIETATDGLHEGDIWITRMRANLSVAALAEDLRLAAHPQQTPLSNVHQALAQGTTVPGGAQIVPRRQTHLGIGVMVLGGVLLVTRILRRRRHS